MRTKLVILGVVMLTGAGVPAGVAHWGVQGGFGDENKPLSATTDGVAGRVVGITEYDIVGIGGGAVKARGLGVCDLEVGDLTDGNAPATNEVEVEEHPTNGTVPDNTWDDGGYGVACHMTSYAESDWNTEGCGEATDQSGARANPASPVLPVFVGAGCDLGTTSGRLSVANAISYGVCVVNTIFTGPEPVQCLRSFQPDPGFRNCQQDGAVDEINLGYADEVSGPSVPTKSETGAAIGGSTDCSDTAGTAVLFVFEMVSSPLAASGPATHVWTV